MTGGDSPVPMPPAWARRLVGWIERRTSLILLSTVLLTALASLSLTQLRFDVDLASMLPRGEARFTDYARYVELFGGRDLTVALVEANDSATAVRFADAFAAALRSRPEVRSVQSRLDLEAFSRSLRDGALPRLLPLDRYPELARRLEPAGIDKAVRGLRLALTAPASVGLSAPLAGDPLGLARLLGDALRAARPDHALASGDEYLLAPDGRRLLVLLEPTSTGYSAEASLDLATAIAAAEAEARGVLGAASGTNGTGGISGTIRVAYTGAFAYGSEDAAILSRDLRVYSVLALVLVLGVFHLGYRSLEILPLVTAQLVATSVVTFALGLLVYGRLNVVSLAFAAIFFGLSIDAAIHYYTRVREEVAEGRGASEAAAVATAVLLRPTAVASATTAAVFVVIGFSALAGVAQLGYLTAAGMMLNLPATFVLLPAMLLRRAGRVGALGGAPGSHDTPRRLPPTLRLAAVAAFSAHHRGIVLAVALVVCSAGLYVASGTALDTSLIRLRPTRSKAAAVQAEIEASFGVSDPEGVVVVEATIPDDTDTGAAGAAALRDGVLVATEHARDLLRRYEGEGLLSGIVDPTPFLPSRSTQERRLRAWAELPRDEAARVLELRLAAEGFRTQAFTSALESLRRVPGPVDATTTSIPGLELLVDRHLRVADRTVAVAMPFAPKNAAALERVAERLSSDLSPTPGVMAEVTGRPLMELALGRAMQREIGWFLVFALASNAILVWLGERSIGRTATFLAAPAAAVIALLGLVDATGLALNPVNLVVLPLTIGMGVDYCVYLAARVRESDGDVGLAMARSGRALAVTAATTIAGFGALALSRYPALAGLGRLGAPAMMLSFTAAIVLLPALLPRVGHPSHSQPRSQPPGAAPRGSRSPSGEAPADGTVLP